MAIKVGGIEVVDNNRQLKNINSVDSGSVNVLNSALNTDPTRATLTKTFTNGETASITLNQAVSTAPVVSVVKEVPQTGFSSKGAWDVNATASNYDLYDYAPNTTLTPTSSTVLDDIDTGSIQGAHLSVSGIFSNGRGVRLSPDGTKAYVINEHRNSGQNTIRQWTLSTPFDTNTATHSGYFAETVGEQYARGFDFNGNGTRLYIIGYNNHQLQEYSLSTAYDVTTATATSTTFTPSPQPGTSTFFTFGDSGYKMYITSTGGNAYLHQYTLSTAYDITSVTNTQTISNPNGAGGGSRGIQFSDDGLTMFNLSQNSNWFIYQNTLSTAWDITSTVTETHTLGVSANANNPMGLYIKDEHVYTFDLGGPHALYYKRTSSSVSNLTLGTGSFTAANVGMRIQGNGGDVRLADTAGNYTVPSGNSDFTDNSTIAAGSWTMHGLAPVANGLTLPNSEVTTQGWTSNFRVAAYSDYDSITGQISTPVGLHMARDGSHYYVCRQSGGIGIWSMSTAFEPSSATYQGIWTGPGGSQSQQDIEFNEDGTRCYINDIYNSNEAVQVWSVTNAWRPDQGATLLSTINLTQTVSDNTPNTGGAIQFSNGGLRFYYQPYAYKSGNTTESSTNKVGTSFMSPIQSNVGVVLQYNLTTAYDLSTATYHGFKRVALYSYASFGITEDGKWLVNGAYNTTDVVYYPIPNAWDITSIDASTEVHINYDTYNRGGTQDGQIASSWVGDNYYVTSYNQNEVIKLPWGPVQGTTTAPVVTDGYQVAVTNASGQIDSASWVDINSMTADQSLGNGEAYYAVSTDDRTTWSVAKGSDGVRPIVRDNAGTWQYNSDAGSVVGWGISNATYDSKSFSVASQDTEPQGIFIDSSGTKLYMAGPTNDAIYQYSLSTAWDISTASHVRTKSLSADDTAIRGVWFKSDGTKMYVGAAGGDDFIYEYHLTTAWDISTAGSIQANIAVTTAISEQYVAGLYIKSDGTQIWATGRGQDKVFGWTLTTAWDISTATSLQQLDVSTQTSTPNDIHFKSDGTELYVCSFGGTYSTHILTYTLSTAWDITTATFSSSLDVSSQASSPQGLFIKDDGTKTYVVGGATDTIYQYTSSTTGFGTGTTWTNATTNDEFYALQEALGATSVNRMNKTQLDAVADGSHFTLGDTLDLMIALKQTTDTLPAPTSDGVSINYDAEALQQGAILGTDYDYQFPNSTTVELTSNAAQNLKIRVV